MKRIYSIIFCIACSLAAMAQHPRLYVTDADKKGIDAKIEKEPWAKEIYSGLTKKIDHYVALQQQDPMWLASRLAMYWKDGEHYTQCYLRDQRWDYGEGNAPVPTVRMPGMRIWNRYGSLPLAERTPYNETGDMWATDPQQGGKKVLVPYRETGHMVRGNNIEILSIAEEAGFLYWMTGDEKYAALAASVYNTWLPGIYYMQPALDPERSTGGAGGWAPDGICGYYDYEQIHDDMAMHAAVVYDFIADYLDRHPTKHLVEINKSTQEVTDTVMKRFINIGMIRGGNKGNWNVNGWNMMLLPILSLRADSCYADGKGRDYYLNHLVKVSTPYHDAIPDIVKTYDPETGLWPESPGYAFSTISMLSTFGVLLQKTGIDIVSQNPILYKASMALLPWLDKRGNVIVFGDSRGGDADMQILENMFTYYTLNGDTVQANALSAVIQRIIKAGNYNRNRAGWKGLCNYLPLKDGVNSKSEKPYFLSPFHRVLTLKNEDASQMAILYGGRNGSHLSANGLALQLYAYGYALAPDAAAYESYWSRDYAYHQKATGANTIIPGYTQGDVKVDAMQQGFAMMTADEKQRSVAMIETGDGEGYYIDVFRSDLDDNDYLFHVVGRELTLQDAGQHALQLQPMTLEKRTEGYNWFKDVKGVDWSKDFCAQWNVTDEIRMKMWMHGEAGRTLYSVMAPSSTTCNGVTPEKVSRNPQPTPTLIVRQKGVNGAAHPFVAVYEPFKQASKISSVKYGKINNLRAELTVTLKDGRKDHIVITTDGKIIKKR